MNPYTHELRWQKLEITRCAWRQQEKRLGETELGVLLSHFVDIFCDGFTGSTKAMGKADSRGNECTC